MTEQVKQYIYNVLIQLSNGQEIDIAIRSSCDELPEVAARINDLRSLHLKECSLLELTDCKRMRTFLIAPGLIEVMDVRKRSE